MFPFIVKDIVNDKNQQMNRAVDGAVPALAVSKHEDEWPYKKVCMCCHSPFQTCFQTKAFCNMCSMSLSAIEQYNIEFHGKIPKCECSLEKALKETQRLFGSD